MIECPISAESSFVSANGQDAVTVAQLVSPISVQKSVSGSGKMASSMLNQQAVSEVDVQMNAFVASGSATAASLAGAAGLALAAGPALAGDARDSNGKSSETTAAPSRAARRGDGLQVARIGDPFPVEQAFSICLPPFAITTRKTDS